MNEALITVFTPAYNRAHTLCKAYEALCRQTDKRFIWMIIDDGSTDNTRQLVDCWKKIDNGFQIKYYYKENGGMHTAHNLAYQNIDTELNVCVDSDDFLADNAVEIILNFWKTNGNDSVAGIIALDADLKGNILGAALPKGIVQCTTTELYQKYHAYGDKKFIYRTEIIKGVEAYPEFSGEKLVPLGYKYMLVDKRYNMLLLNQVVCIVDYLPNGSSNTIFRQYLQSPRGFAASNRLSMQYSISWKEKVKSIIHYIAECRIANEKCIANSPLKLQTIVLYPLGILAVWYIHWVVWRMKR